VPKLRRQTVETAIIERYKRREAPVEEALIEMYLAGVSVLGAIGVNRDGYRKILGVVEGHKEDKAAARDKADHIYRKFMDLRLKEAAKKIKESIEETLVYYDFPGSQHRLIRTNNAPERIMKEIRRRNKVVGAFPDGKRYEGFDKNPYKHLEKLADTEWGKGRETQLP